MNLQGATRGNSSLSRKANQTKRQNPSTQTGTEKRGANSDQENARTDRKERAATSTSRAPQGDENHRQGRQQKSLSQAERSEENLADYEAGSETAANTVAISRVTPILLPTVQDFLQERIASPFPSLLLNQLDEEDPEIFWADLNSSSRGIACLWSDNLGVRPSIQVSFWLTEASDHAIRKWIDVSLLDAIKAYGHQSKAGTIFARAHDHDDVRREALAASGFKPIDDILTMGISSSKIVLDGDSSASHSIHFKQVEPKKIVQLHNAAYADDPQTIKLNAKTADNFVTPGSEVWVVQQNGKDAGFIEISGNGRVMTRGGKFIKSGFIESLAVLPEYLKTGLGEALVKHGLARLLEMGVRSVLVKSKASNFAALKVYKKYGFQIIDMTTLWQYNVK